MKPLRISGALKVAAGITTIDEVMKVAPPVSGASCGPPPAFSSRWCSSRTRPRPVALGEFHREFPADGSRPASASRWSWSQGRHRRHDVAPCLRDTELLPPVRRTGARAAGLGDAARGGIGGPLLLALSGNMAPQDIDRGARVADGEPASASVLLVLAWRTLPQAMETRIVTGRARPRRRRAGGSLGHLLALPAADCGQPVAYLALPLLVWIALACARRTVTTSLLVLLSLMWGLGQRRFVQRRRQPRQSGVHLSVRLIVPHLPGVVQPRAQERRTSAAGLRASLQRSQALYVAVRPAPVLGNRTATCASRHIVGRALISGASAPREIRANRWNCRAMRSRPTPCHRPGGRPPRAVPRSADHAHQRCRRGDHFGEWRSGVRDSGAFSATEASPATSRSATRRGAPSSRAWNFLQRDWPERDPEPVLVKNSEHRYIAANLAFCWFSTAPSKRSSGPTTTATTSPAQQALPGHGQAGARRPACARPAPLPGSWGGKCGCARQPQDGARPAGTAARWCCCS